MVISHFLQMRPPSPRSLLICSAVEERGGIIRADNPAPFYLLGDFDYE